MREDPFAGDIARLHGQPTAWRRRIGNWRILYDLYPERQLIVVAAVRRRTSTTY
jgi:mRNA-degrading endonuclease RelE of RelBE toxin-antitoxin system